MSLYAAGTIILAPRARIHPQDNREIEEFAYLGSIREHGKSKMEMIKRICQTKILFNQKKEFYFNKYQYTHQ